MKEEKHEMPRTGRRKRPRKASAEQKIIFGNYQIKNGQQILIANKLAYPVAEIRDNVPLPLDENATVKALLRTDLKTNQSYATVLRVLRPRLPLKELIAKAIKDGDIPVEFDKKVFEEAALYGEEVSKDDRKKRLDLTKLALCTIDGETAKDFDDAVYAEAQEKNIRVYVAIADVSHYVKIGTALDEEAANRGTSVYYPGHCVPMLPESLSNGLCSLKPNVLRLAIAVIFDLGPKGGITKPRIEPVVIKSAARLTYNQVQQFYDDKKADAAKWPTKVKSSLTMLKKAAHILRAAREKRGAIDFDITESVIALDEHGEPTSLHPQDRLDAHRIIEDLMVATNEIVARFFVAKKLPGLFRVHEPPDSEKLDNFFKTANAFGALKGEKTKSRDVTDPKTLQKIMASYQSSKYKDTLNTLMLRSMMQARYSEKNLCHFGLASSAYLHFTSPIRRYADLIVHRQLRYFLFEKKPNKKIPEALMAKIAEGISQKEVRATETERKIDRLFAATFMSSHVGEVFDAVIVACTEFGFFVRIVAHHVEGLVHIASISSHRVNFIPERMSLVVSGTNKQFMVGDRVRVQLINVNVERGHIDFELAREHAREEKEKKPRKKRNRNR